MTATVQEFASRWRNGAGGNFVTDRWAKERPYRLRRVLELFGDVPLDEIRPSHFWQLQERCRGEGLAPSTINKVAHTLSALLRDAEAEGLVDEGVREEIRRRVKPLKVSHENSFRPFSRVERDTILGAFRDDAPGWYPLILTGFLTGMRLSELAGLAWAHLDLSNRQCRIRQSRDGNDIGACKTSRSRREIKLAASVVMALRGVERRHELVFVGQRAGKPLNFDNFNRHVWVPMVRRLHVPDLSFR